MSGWPAGSRCRSEAFFSGYRDCAMLCIDGSEWAIT